jgi:hypothetical protein
MIEEITVPPVFAPLISTIKAFIPRYEACRTSFSDTSTTKPLNKPTPVGAKCLDRAEQPDYLDICKAVVGIRFKIPSAKGIALEPRREVNGRMASLSSGV